jgi:hypothetical protein
MVLDGFREYKEIGERRSRETLDWMWFRIGTSLSTIIIVNNETKGNVRSLKYLPETSKGKVQLLYLSVYHTLEKDTT